MQSRDSAGRPVARTRAAAGRKKTYRPEKARRLEPSWLLTDPPCGKRLAADLSAWRASWERHHGPLPAELRSSETFHWTLTATDITSG
jgi:hypothetical protein